MPKGFVKLERRGGGHAFYVAVDSIARFGQYLPTGSYVILKTIDEGENDKIVVEHSPWEIAEMLEQAQGALPPNRLQSGLAQAMGEAITAFGGAR